MRRVIIVIGFLLLICAFPLVRASAESDNKEVSFVVFGHVYPDYYSLRNSINQVNAFRPDFVVFCGDNILGEKNYEDEYGEFLEIIKDIESPVYLLPGNHDNLGYFIDHISPVNQSFSIRNNRFILLSSLDGSGAGISEETKHFILEEMQAAKEENIIMFMHHNLFKRAALKDEAFWNSTDSSSVWEDSIVPAIKDRVSMLFLGDTTSSVLFKVNNISVQGIGYPHVADKAKYASGFLLAVINSNGLSVKYFSPYFFADSAKELCKDIKKYFKNYFKEAIPGMLAVLILLVLSFNALIYLLARLTMNAIKAFSRKS